jgi:hypothetical protein
MEWLDQLRQEGEHATRLANDLPYYAERLLKIRPKAAGIVPFVFNSAQLELHRRLEAQLAETRKVRAVILKSRQTGVSTYLAARFYKATTTQIGVRTMIVAHEKSASRNLYGMVKRFWDLMPAEHKLAAPTANQDELIFDNDSGYQVAIASPEGAGRSATCQYLHGSETAYWANMSEQQAALMQTVPNLPGTEVVFETTADQMGSDFHRLWSRTLAGENAGWQAIFLPWFSDVSCRADVPDGFEMASDEAALAEMYNLEPQQIYWRRLKLSEMGDEKLFCREYPANPTEAFVSADFDSFLPIEDVMRARKETELEPSGALVLGVDIARKGKDSTCIAWRRGRVITKIEKYRDLDLMQVAGLVAKLIREEKPERVFCDSTGLGVGVTDRLHEQGYHEVVGVNFSGKPVEPSAQDEQGRPTGGAANRRAELYIGLKRALEGRLKIPDSDALAADLTSTGFKYDSSGRVTLESKDDVRKRLGASPDESDAVALTFAQPIGAPPSRASNFNRKIIYPEMGLA